MIWLLSVCPVFGSNNFPHLMAVVFCADRKSVNNKKAVTAIDFLMYSFLAEINIKYSHQLTSYNSSHLDVYLGLRNSCRIFQSRVVPEAANFITSSRILKFTLSIIPISMRPLF